MGIVFSSSDYLYAAINQENGSNTQVCTKIITTHVTTNSVLSAQTIAVLIVLDSELKKIYILW